MSAAEVLNTLEEKGYTLYLSGEKLRARGPAPPSEDLRRVIDAERGALIALLKERAEAPLREAWDVLSLAREFFGPSIPFDPSEHPPPLNWVDPERERFYFPERYRNAKPPEKTGVSPLALAIRIYLDRHPHRADETPSWLAVTLWACDSRLEEKPTPAEVRVAMNELDHVGGEV